MVVLEGWDLPPLEPTKSLTNRKQRENTRPLESHFCSWAAGPPLEGGVTWCAWRSKGCRLTHPPNILYFSHFDGLDEAASAKCTRTAKRPTRVSIAAHLDRKLAEVKEIQATGQVTAN